MANAYPLFWIFAFQETPIHLCGLHCDDNKNITICLFHRMCNVHCIELSDAQLQTTIQPLISHVTDTVDVFYA